MVHFFKSRLFVKIFNIIFIFVFIKRLPIYIVVHRSLNILNIKHLILRRIRKRYIINVNSVHADVFDDFNKVGHNYFNGVYDEKICYDEGKFIFEIGSYSKILNINVSVLDKSDYIHPYLFWYFNWIHDNHNLFIETFARTSTKVGLALEPHPIANRIINIIAIWPRLCHLDNLLRENIKKFVIDDFNVLILNTEEDVGGNHLIDNYLAIILVSRMLNKCDCSAYFERKLSLLIKGSHYLKENNPSYAKLLYRKVCFIIILIGDVDALITLRNQLFNSIQAFGDFNFHDYYNDSKIPIAIDRTYFRPDCSFRWRSSDDTLEFLIGMNMQSEPGYNGHDHDNNSSLFLKSEGRQLIGGKGTICYKNNMRRFINKSNVMSPSFRSSRSQNQVILGCFRSLSLGRLSYDSELDEKHRFLKIKAFQGRRVLDIAVKFDENFFNIMIGTGVGMIFSFYSEFEIVELEDCLTLGPLKLNGVRIVSVSKSKIHKSLYRNVAAIRIKLMTDSNKLSINYVG